MSSEKSSHINRTLDELLDVRFHGAKNIAGIRYQLLYSVLRVFDLYEEPTSNAQFEGLEDIDVKSLRGRVGNCYFQVKSSQSKQGWGWFNKERILDHFIEVFLVDPNAKFVIVTNFEFSGQLLKELEQFCSGKSDQLTPNARQKMVAIANRSGLNKSRIAEFLGQVTFERESEQSVLAQLRATIIKHFKIYTANEKLYLSHLFSCVAQWAANRSQIDKNHLNVEKLRVNDWISLGITNPAVRDRLIEPLIFAEEIVTADYYEGKKARPGHILASLDAPRPMWNQKIFDTLNRVQVCIIKASSGQGKSTLLYRYALDHFIPDTIFRINTCNKDEQVGTITDYLQNRLILGLPLLVLIDNLSYSKRLWHQISSELAGENIKFLITAREEDWYRYGLDVSGFVWDFVEPQLDLAEAQDIFLYFQQQNKVANNVPSAEWAYEQVSDKNLLIEFIYLITHGQMLAERIEEQIKTIETQQEDPAKLDILRLITTAQVYGARVGIQTLLQNVMFQRDAQYTLKSLEHEYIECSDGECDGLHFIRSEHLVTALHTPLPIEHTLTNLIKLLDQTNLVALVSSAFADTSIAPDDLLIELIERSIHSSLNFIDKVAEALFIASEKVFFQTQRHLFDSAVKQTGPSSLLMITNSTLPSSNFTIIEELFKQFPDNPGIQFLYDLLSKFTSRETIGSQNLPRDYLERIVGKLHITCNSSLIDVANISIWCQFFNIPTAKIDNFFENDSWESAFFQLGKEDTSLFLHSLYNRLPERHKNFLESHKKQLFSQFKLMFDVLTIKEQKGEIFIEFVVEENNKTLNPNDQAVSRLGHLHRWFPHYSNYRSRGIFPSTGGLKPEVDDTEKQMTEETLERSIHASMNAIYSRLVEEHYAARLSYDWAQHWYKLRSKSLELIRTLISLYEGVYKGRQFNTRKLNPLANELHYLYQQAPRLPTRLVGRFSSQQRIIEQWLSPQFNFLQQYFQHDPNDSDNRISLLMRYNLKDSIKIMPEMHQAFSDIFQVEIDHFAMAALDNDETTFYSRLVDFLDYWFEERQRRTHNIQSTIRLWKENQRKSFEHKVRSGLTLLSEAGFDFLYPIMPLDEHPLTSLCLGYEILDFEQHDKQVGMIGVVVAILDLWYDFLYLVPTVHEQQYGTHITRISRETLQQLASGENVQGGVYPVEPPKGLYHVLPDLKPVPPPDVNLVQRLGDIQAYLILERNKLFFARSKLAKDEGREERVLIQKYEELFSENTRGLMESFQELEREALGYKETGSGNREWIALWNRGKEIVYELAEKSNIDKNYKPQPILQQSEINQILSKYMNRKYLGL